MARWWTSLIAPLLLAAAPLALAGWTFDDGVLSTITRGEAEASHKENFAPTSPISETVKLTSRNVLRLQLTTKDGSSPKRPHQAFVYLKDQGSDLETHFVINVKDSGKGKLDISQREIPSALLSSPNLLDLTLVLASFGSSDPLQVHIASLNATSDGGKINYEKPVRYGKLDEIHHVYRPEPKSPPKVITLAFLAGVLVQLPVLVIGWATQSANLSALGSSLSKAPIAHPTFFVSLLALEGIFIAYYVKINLFQALAGVGIVAPVAFLSGSRALREVRERRLKGER